MGNNSTEVAYGFGQFGSVFTNLNKPVFPPKDRVIVAIQFLADNILSNLDTETLDTHGPQYITIEDDETKAAGGPDANYIGVTKAAVNALVGGGTGGVVTIAATNTRIKKGQYVLIAADTDTIDIGFTIDTGAGHKLPIYNGPNQQGVIVKSISGTTLTLEHHDGAVFDAQNIDTSNTLYFLDEYHAAGGTTIESVRFPKGLTIYGRWTSVTPAADADGGIICYFGQ